MASIPKRVSERIAKQTRKYQGILKNAVDRDINESDTVLIVTDMLERIFGYDRYSEMTSEYAIRSTYCDIAVKVDEKVKYLIEVKAIGLELRDTHINQAVGYGAQHGIQWVVLTNGVIWEIYRIRFERPIGHDLICTFKFLELNGRKKEDQEILFLLCKEGLSKDVIEEYHEHVKSVNRFMISAVLQTSAGLNMLRRELRRVSPGIKVETQEIADILTGEVLKREVLDGVCIDDARARVKKASSRALRKKKKAQQ